MANYLTYLMENINNDSEKNETLKEIEAYWLEIETWLIVLQDHASIDEI